MGPRSSRCCEICVALDYYLGGFWSLHVKSSLDTLEQYFDLTFYLTKGIAKIKHHRIQHILFLTHRMLNFITELSAYKELEIRKHT